jgi:CBS domain-containing protein
MKITAREIMNRNVISVGEKMDLRDLAKLFLDKGITGAPVVDDAGRLAGVVSQTDLVYYNLTRDDELVLPSDFYQHARVEGQHLPKGFQIEDTNTATVADVMTPIVHSVTERASVESIARLMTRSHIHRVIVRRGNEALGVISALDVLRALSKPNANTRPKAAKKAAKKAASRRKTPARAARKR